MEGSQGQNKDNFNRFIPSKAGFSETTYNNDDKRKHDL